MSTSTIDGGTILNSLPEPALIVTPDGIIKSANSAAASLVDRQLVGVRLHDVATGDPQKISDFLSLCSGVAKPIMGAIHLVDKSGVQRKYKCRGNAVFADGRKLLFIRFANQATDRFAVLTGRLKKLNDEIRCHLHTQAALEESLRERELLIREMHHRVKNNIQLLHGMLAMAAKEASQPEARQKLEDSARRLAAIGTVQQTLYSSPELTTYRADKFLGDLVSHFKATWPNQVNITFAVDPIDLPSEVATPLALIINELLTNALKHGLKENPEAPVAVELSTTDGEMRLTVRDPGPGFRPSELKNRSSGIGLVRGLLRQLGGSFSVDYDNGAKCTVRLPSISR